MHEAYAQADHEHAYASMVWLKLGNGDTQSPAWQRKILLLNTFRNTLYVALADN